MSNCSRILPAGIGGGPIVGRDPCDVSFIVPAFMAVATLRACVESIRDAAPVSSEILVVVDGSLDETPDLAGELADVVVVRPCQGGAARARNDGAQMASGKVLFFVDSDVTVNRAAVNGVLAHLQKGADAVFGAYQPLPPEAVRNAATTYKNLLHHYTHLHGRRRAQTFWSGFGAIRRSAFTAVNGFDPSVTTSADVEDIHLGYRLRAAGFEIVLDPSLQVTHHKRYTVRSMIASDVFHRAIPWTRAILQLRFLSSDLNTRPMAMAAALLANAIPIMAVASLSLGLHSLGLAGAMLVTWVGINWGFLSFAWRMWPGRGRLSSAGLLYLYFLYGPVGVLMGAVGYVLRKNRKSQLNWLQLRVPEAAPPELAVSLAIVPSAREPVSVPDGLPSAGPWWELLVVGTSMPAALPPNARFLRAPEGATRCAMAQMALEASAGEMFAVLSPGAVPGPGWLDRIRSAASGADLAIGGSFSHDRRSARHRAAQVSGYWNWRPERGSAWTSHHPIDNIAFRREVALALGGFTEEQALLSRLGGFGSRPIRFDPVLTVSLSAAPDVRGLLAASSASARRRSAACARYFDLGVFNRVLLAAAAPVHAALTLARTARAAVRERSADRTFWLAMPLIAVATFGHDLGRAAGLLRPGNQGGLVPRTVDDMALLASPIPTLSVNGPG